AVAPHQHLAMLDRRPPSVERVRAISEREIRMLCEVIDEPIGGPLQCGSGLGGEEHQLPGAARPGGGPARGLLKHHMGVRAANAKGTDPGTAWCRAARPPPQAGIRVKGTIAKTDLGMGVMNSESAGQ